MQRQYSFIVPVYNRPDEIKELLDSFSKLKSTLDYEIVIVEDGSTITSEAVIDNYLHLNISYYKKENTGPGDTRNDAMRHARGNYFIILDSDCLLPEHYLTEVHKSLEADYVDCFGGPDAAHPDFSKLQKAINFAMTATVTTGGIRGRKHQVGKFQPRSFNMGLSKKAFLDSQGFGRIHPGEDPDLTIRLWGLGYQTKLIPRAFVYHKRRVSWKKFFNQVYKFGMTRPIINQRYPHTKRLTYWFPSLFLIGFLMAISLAFLGYFIPILGYAFYFLIVFLAALFSTKTFGIAVLAVLATGVQFLGYGYGFLKSTWGLSFFKKDPETLFPYLFFNPTQ